MKKYTDAEIPADGLKIALIQKSKREAATVPRKQPAARRPIVKATQPAKRGPAAISAPPPAPAAPKPVIAIHNLKPDVEAAMEAMKAVHRRNTLPQRGS